MPIQPSSCLILRFAGRPHSRVDGHQLTLGRLDLPAPPTLAPKVFYRVILDEICSILSFFTKDNKTMKDASGRNACI